jgi:hypothetical protein
MMMTCTPVLSAYSARRSKPCSVLARSGYESRARRKYMRYTKDLLGDGKKKRGGVVE